MRYRILPLRVAAMAGSAALVTVTVLALRGVFRSPRDRGSGVAETKLESVFARHASQEAESADTPPFVTRGFRQPAPVRCTVGARLRDLANVWAQGKTDEARAALIERFAARLDAALVQDALDRLAGPEEMLGPLEHALFARLAEFDPTAAVARLEKTLPAGSRRDELQLGIALQWAETDLPSAIAWVAQWPAAAVQTRAVDELRALFAAANPDEMQDLGAIVAALPRGQMKIDLLDGLVQQWGEGDFPGALAWVQALPMPADQERALLHLSYRWGQSARDEALAFAQTLPEGRDALVVTLAAQWAQTEPQAAAKWATSLPDSPRRENALSSLLAVWAQQDPRAARDFLLQLPPSPARNDAAISVLAAWAAREPAFAAQWAEGFPAGQKRDYAIENVAYRWVQSDPVAAIGWLERLPAGRERDVALHAGAGSLIDTYPDLAAQLAVGIGDMVMRHQQTECAARAWLAVDREDAQTWIEQSSLPAAIKQQLLPPPRS